jgi:non-heme chloroperoxidase
MKSHTVRGGGGIKLHVEETGKPAGKAILFIHGLSQSSVVWSRQMQSDLADTFRLAAVDIRGHGQSDKPFDAYGDSRLWADDIKAVIDELELDKPLVVAWSYGGAIICDYIACYGEDEISATNWIGAVCRLGEPLRAADYIGKEFAAMAQGLFSENVGESVAAAQKLISLGISSKVSAEELYLLLGSSMVVPPYVRAGLLARNLDNDGVVRKMKKPMLLSWGEADAVIPPRMGDHIAMLASHARVSKYPGVGHAPFWEASERFNQELREFRQSA